MAETKENARPADGEDSVQQCPAEPRRFWAAGMRTWKTVVAVFLALLIDSGHPGSMPFYAAIAAVICIQPNPKSSLEVAVNREIATLIGGAVGLGFLMLEICLGRFDPPVLRYALLAVCLVPLISLSVWMGRAKSTFLTCVVFLSVALLHASDTSPYLFAWNRVLDTSIGIGVALAVNILPEACRSLRGRHSPGTPDDRDS